MLTTVSVLALGAALASAQDYPVAEVQGDLPAATYTATLPATQFSELGDGGAISGTVTGSTEEGDSGVTFHIALSNLPDAEAYGPFTYHLHAAPVPADGNCTGAAAHLDPTGRGQEPKCDADAVDTCEAGDLAGKHGSISEASYDDTYVDEYVSTEVGSDYFFGDKSVVIHAGDGSRLTCANFTMGESHAGNGTGTASPTGGYSGGNGTSPAPTSEPSPYTPEQTGGAGKLATGGAIVGFAGVLAMLL